MISIKSNYFKTLFIIALLIFQYIFIIPILIFFFKKLIKYENLNYF